jgi:hypothetical protein
MGPPLGLHLSPSYPVNTREDLSFGLPERGGGSRLGRVSSVSRI